MKNLVKKIVRALLDVHDYMTTDELAKMINVSASSIKHNIRNAREELGKYGIDLISVSKKGLCLDADNEQRVRALKAIDESESPDSFFYRKNYILDTLLHYDSVYTIQLFAEELYVSRSIIQRDLQYIENILERHNLKITKKRNVGIIVEGNEFNKRQVIIEHNLKKFPDIVLAEKNKKIPKFDRRISPKKYSYFLAVYPEVDFRELQMELQEAEKMLGILFSDDSFCQLVEYIAVSLGRIEKGNTIVIPKDMSIIEIGIEQEDIAEKLLRNLLGKEIKETEMEKHYLAVKFLAHRTCTSTVTESSRKYRNNAKKFVSEIGSVIGANTLHQNSSLINNLAVFFERLKFRDYYQIIVWDDIHHDIKEKFASLYGICLAALYGIEEELGVNFTQDDVAWIVLLIHNTITETVKPKAAALITASDSQTSKYMANKLMEKIVGLDVKEISHYKNFNLKHFGKFPLIITTVALDINNSAVISKEINDYDIEVIQRKIDEKFYDEIVSANIFEEVFHRELVICDLYAEDKRDAIEKICNIMIEKGYVKKGFEGKVWERENKTPTSIGSQIAIPHVYKEFVDKTAIAVARLKHPVVWNGDDKIRLILLMALDINSKNKMKKLLQKLYMFIDNAEKQTFLLDAANSEEMFQVLVR